MSSTGASIRRDADGNPVWTFRVTDALLQANRRIAFPKEVAAHLGCKPGGLTRVAVENPVGCRKLKVCLEQGNPPRTVVLNIAEPLMGIGASHEQSVDLVVTGLRRVALRRSGASRHREPIGEPEDTPARDSQSNSPQEHSGSLDESPISTWTIGKEKDATAADEEGSSTTIAYEALTSDAVELIATAAREFRGATTFGDLLRLDLSDLVAAAGADEQVDDLSLETGETTVADRAIEFLDECLDQMSATQRLVVLKRVVPAVPETLKVLGQSTGLSRERVRQLDKQARAALEEAAGRALGLLRLIASQRLGAVTTVPGIDDIVGELLPQSDDKAGLDSLMLARRMLRSRLDYECREGLCLSRAAADAAKELNDLARQLVDDEGLLDLDAVRAALAEHWHDSLDDLIRWIGWPRVSGRIALRATARARTKAALLKIGAPATKAELATESGLTERQVAGALSNIESVARADKLRWGLREWIDDVYEGIPAEIIQRIEEDGGSTRLNRLLDELPRLFGVNEMSVRAYVATPAFRVEHGWVSIADEPDCVIGRFKDVASGRTSDDDPYWTFSMHERYRRGFSIVGIPPELAVELGCGFGGRVTVAVRSPQGSRPVSINWRKTALTGPEIGRVADAMKAITAHEGDLICLVVHGEHEISFTRAESITTALVPSGRTNAHIPSPRSSDTSAPSVEGPYLGVRTGTPIAARLMSSTRSIVSSRDQASHEVYGPRQVDR